jgi:hypothetical protein
MGVNVIMTDVMLLKKRIPTLTLVEFLNDVFNVKLTKLPRNIKASKVKQIFQKLINENVMDGMIVVDEFEDVIQYFRESLDGVIDIPAELSKYFDIVQFIIDVIKSKEFSIYNVEIGDESIYVIIFELDLTFDEVIILKSFEELINK